MVTTVIQRRVHPPQEVADEHTLVAQRYGGYFVGHPYRNVPQTTMVHVDRKKQWREPPVVADDCLFCAKMTDAEVERRVVGYQAAIDIEVLRRLGKAQAFTEWLQDRGIESLGNIPVGDTMRLRREFIELVQDVPRENRPDGWKTTAFPLVHLPLRLKRKMAIEWNHILLKWMTEAGTAYDFQKREFYDDVKMSLPAEEDGC